MRFSVLPLDKMNYVHYSAAMPKIIKNLEQKILESSEDLLKQVGYDGMNMRLLAQQLGIAPGTIYNYYSGKSEICYRIFSRSWEQTKENIKAIASSDIPEAQKGSQLVSAIYHDSLQRYETLYAAFSAGWKIKKFGEHWRRVTSETPEEIAAVLFQESSRADRHGVLFLQTLRGLIIQYPGEHEENIAYLVSVYHLLRQELL